MLNYIKVNNKNDYLFYKEPDDVNIFYGKLRSF